MDAITKFEDLIIRQKTSEMLDLAVNVGFKKIVIAMKGEAYSGKTTCADAIAEAYNCSVVSLDHIIDSLSPSAPSPGEAEALIDLAFDILLRFVRRQTVIGRPVVVDSPLTKQNHLDKLVAVVDGFQSCGNPDCSNIHCAFVIVECKPGTSYTWEKRFEDRDKAAYGVKWYKPKEWSGVFPASIPFPENNNPWERSLPGYASRLIVDTTLFVPANYRNLGLATLDLCACLQGHIFDFRNWLPHTPYHIGFNPAYGISKISGRAPPSQVPKRFSDLNHHALPPSHDQSPLAPPVTPINCSHDGRHMLQKVRPVEGLEPCRACRKGIDRKAYACSRCSLILHKSCAKLKKKSTVPDPHSNLPSYLQIQSSPDEFYANILEEYKYKCDLCPEFSVNCGFCLWEMHLRSRVVPTMVVHEGHEGGDHPIWFWITPATNQRDYLCDACRLPGACVGYQCDVCSSQGTFKANYHVECALLPRPVRHVHGGHHHKMNLLFGTDEEKEDYICDVCQDPILDPAAWYYYCPKCNYVSHLRCIYIQDC